MSKIEMRHIEDINQMDSGAYSIHFNNGRAPICLRDKEKVEDLILKLRAYRRAEADPQDRIIGGIDSINECGIWDLDKEKEALKSTMTLRELKKWRDLGENELSFLLKLSDLNDYSDSIVDGLKAKYEALVETIQSSPDVIKSDQFTIEELDTLKNMLKIIKELSETSRRFGTATLSILNKWIPDYSTKEQENEH